MFGDLRDPMTQEEILADLAMEEEERRARAAQRLNRRTFLMGMGVALGAVAIPAWLQPLRKAALAEAEPLWRPTLELQRFAGVISISEEALLKGRGVLFERGLTRIGRQLAQDQADRALDVLLRVG